ncbi:MAG: 30S ribosome-binding factor RbfA [Planctomycetes bacterium]|nr:30S ribosome-binding factor RbfA [Planctomycetota bacterium]
MSNRREQRLSELIKTTLGEILLPMQDPRLSMVTVTRVELTLDLRGARVFFSTLGDEARQRRAQQGLEHARVRLQSEIHRLLRLRYTPVLTFIYDPAIAQSIRIAQILKEVLPASPTGGDSNFATATTGAASAPNKKKDEDEKVDEGGNDEANEEDEANEDEDEEDEDEEDEDEETDEEDEDEETDEEDEDGWDDESDDEGNEDRGR